MFQIGEYRIHLINDSTIKADPGGAFGLVPRALWAPLMPPDANHLIPMVHICLLVQGGGKNILIDTGNGTKLSEKQRANMQLEHPQGGLLAGLARLGLSAADIHLVIDTHLHADHAGGNTYLDDSGQIQATFPTAQYVVQRREYEDAVRPNERTRATYILENYQPLYVSGQMRLLDGATELAPGIIGHVTSGHTPGHMSIEIASGGQHGLFVCDMASFATHFERLGWMTAWDVEPLITLETKRRWQRWALEIKALLFFAHDPLRPVGRYGLNDAGKAVVQPIEYRFA
jgi:glyoxylase-like metal-dependent hydrolase (beta-lactamase superfamily II)